MEIARNLVIPVAQAFVFVASVYFQKAFRKKILKKKQWKPYSRIIIVSIITFILMVSTYTEQCQKHNLFSQSVQSCFYLNFNLHQIITLLMANTILFGASIIERIFNNTFNLSNVWVKTYFFGPLLQQLLFRATFYRVSHGKVPLFILSFIFAISHIHRPVWKHFQNKQKNWQKALFQTAFTFVFGYYSFFFLDKFQSIIPSIFLHSYCNILGPPRIDKKNFIFHLICIALFFYYVLNFI